MSVLENFIKIKNSKIFSIGNICIETIWVNPNITGVRVARVQSDFKQVFCMNMIGFITEGQSSENTMRQVFHSGYETVVRTKTVRIYCAGNQSIELTVIGEI